MKRTITLTLAALMLLTLCACGQQTPETTAPTTLPTETTLPVETTVPETEAVAQLKNVTLYNKNIVYFYQINKIIKILSY